MNDSGFDDVDYAIAVDGEDYPHLPDAAEASLDQVSRMLRAMRRLGLQLAEYNGLHDAELARLDAERERHTAGLVRRFQQLQATLERYGRRAYEDFGKTKIATPNGVITVGRQMVEELEAADPGVLAIDPWFKPIAEYKAVLPKDALRSTLDDLIEAGLVKRAVRAPGELTVLDGFDRVKHPLDKGSLGVYVRVVADEAGVVDYEELPALRWSPTGTDGLGRNIKVVPA